MLMSGRTRCESHPIELESRVSHPHPIRHRQRNFHLPSTRLATDTFYTIDLDLGSCSPMMMVLLA